MNMFKKNGGFTLVELIVVIAILAILAAVAIPAYSGYIEKANDSADTTALAAIKTAVMGALATKGTVTEIQVSVDTATGNVVAVKATANGQPYDLMNATAAAEEADEAKDFDMYITANVPVMKGSFKTKGGATWTTSGDNANKWIAATVSGEPLTPAA